jgi:hypothetical protein
MSLFCPNIESDDFKEMLGAFGGEQEAYIYHLWNENNGNPLYLDPKGNPSELFEDLLGYTDGDRNEALRLKSTVYNYKFRDYFGDWINNELSPETNNIYDNGEPQMDNILDIKLLEKRKPGHMDKRIQDAIDKYGEDTITDLNNPNVWDIENELDLLDKAHPFTVEEGKQFRKKNLQAFTNAKAKVLMAKVVELGGYAYPIDMRMPNGTIRTAIGVGYKIGRPSNKAASSKSGKALSIGGMIFDIKEGDRLQLANLINKIERYDATGMYLLDTLLSDYGSFYHNHPELLEAANLLVKHRSGNKSLRVKVSESNTTSPTNYMDYDVKTNTITLYRKRILEDPTMEGFLTAFVHEVYHGFTTSTLYTPVTEIDKQFATTMKEIVADLKKHGILKNMYAITDEHEFVATFKTDPSFAASLKKYSAPGSTKSFLDRFIDALTTLLYRLTKYDIRKEKGENLYDYAHKAINDFINSKTEYWNEERYKQNGVYRRKAAEIDSEYSDIQKSIDPKNIESIGKAFTAVSSFYKREKEIKGKYEGVTSKMAEAGYGISEKRLANMTPTQLSNMKRSATLGTAVHRGLEGIAKDIAVDILQETGVNVSDDAITMLESIIKEIKKSKTGRGGSITAFSEVRVIDPSLKMTGVIDLVLIDNNNRIHIFDFKTKEGNGWQWYASTKYGPTEKAKDHLQLGIYKHMLEKFLNMPVFSMNVVMLKATVKDNVVGSVALDPTQFPSGMDTFTKEETTVRKIIGESPINFHWSRAQAKLTADAEYMKSMEYKLSTMESDKVSSLDKIYNDTVKVLDDKLEIIRKRYAYSKTRSFEEFVTAISQESSTSAALLAVIKYANETTDQLVSRYNKMLQKGEQFTPKLLMEWRDYITSYDTLDDLQLLLSNDKTLLGDPTALGMLRSLIAKKKQITQIYETEGKQAIARRLAPFYNEIKVRRKEELEKKYRVLEYRYKKGKGELTPDEKEMLDKNTTINEFVDTNLSKEKDAIDKLTYETLLKELSVAANDVNEITRWVDNLQDASDPVVAGIVSAYNKADEKSRIEAIDKRVQIVRTLRKLEEAKGKTGMTSEKVFYKSILEVDDKGDTTNYIIRPWHSMLDEEEKAVRKANKTKTDEKAAEDTSAWLEANLPLESHRDEYLSAFDKYLQVLVADGKISADEKEIIIDNEYFKGAPLTYLAKDEYDTHGNLITKALISEDASDLALTWKGKNKKLYSDIAEKWVNPQWNKFLNEVGVDTKLPTAKQMEALRASENPMAQFYTLITDMAAEGDSGLPYNYRLGYRLPGVSKTKNESIREGQPLTTTFKEAMSIGFVRRIDDTTYQVREFTDEKGNPKYFLPIHYTAKLNNDQQSYDLATIYYKFWESANDYTNKREILPTLEMAKYFVENRKTERKDSLGNRVMSVIRGSRAATESDVSVNNTSNLASMLKDWFEVYIYGNSAKPAEIRISDELVVDGQKLVDGLNAFTSLNLLALNVVQGIANVVVGEVFSGIDAVAGEYITSKSWTQANVRYSKWFPKMLGDIGTRTPGHVSSLIIEYFNALNEDVAASANFANNTKLKAKLTMSALGFAQEGGEHWLRARLIFGLLFEKQAYDKNGKLLGPMIDQYYSEHGELKLKPEVDAVKSGWTQDDITRFTVKFHGIATRIHGAYGMEEKVAAQRYIIGKLAYMYRKFIIPGIRRRYGKMEYSERLQQTTEGNYVTTWKFFAKMFTELNGMKFALMGENWAALSPHEKANIKRTLGEVSTLISVIILANFAYTNWGDDDTEDKRFWALLAYQSYRLKAELLFYSPKLDESMSLLRSPAASMSVLENIIKLSGQIFNPFEEYQRGPWKGHYKLTKDVINFIPVYKQYYKFRDIEEQIQWFR